MERLETENTLKIVFCGKGSCKCPSIDISKSNGVITIGGEEEGYTQFTKEQFKMFLEEAKKGTFEKYL
tara:strand:+ start:166 stop:369 length:204 start_codon:yes stop_codon:yes gene_type:complete